MTLLEKILIGGLGIFLIGALLGTGSESRLFSPQKGIEDFGVGSKTSLLERESTSGEWSVSPSSPEVANHDEAAGEDKSQQTSKQDRLVIRTGDLNLVVDDIWQKGKKIIEFAESQGGYVVSSSIQETGEIPTGNVVVRVPENKFDETMNFAKQLAEKVEYEGRKGEDITEEYVDLEAKLKALEAKKAQFLEVLKKAEKIEDILKVYDKIEEVQAEINQIKGRMRYLQENTKMAKISINLALSEDLLPIPPTEKWRPSYVAKQAWQDTVKFWRNMSYGVIEFFVKHLLTWIAVLAVLALVLWKPVKKVLKKLRERKREAKEGVSVQESSSNAALASLICGILGIVFVFIRPTLGLILGGVALYLGTKEGKKGYAKTGFILGAIAAGLALLALITSGGVINPLIFD